MRRRLAVLSLLPVLALAACGASAPNNGSSASPAPTLTSAASAAVHETVARRSCPAQVAEALGEVASRIYNEAASGGDVQQAVHRVQRSTALARAISANDASATAATLRALQAGQIARIEIVKAGKVFASAGSGPAIAPARGAIAGSDASFVLSTQAAAGYIQVTRQLTGAGVVLLGSARASDSSGSGSGGGSGSGTRQIAGTLAGSALPGELPSSGSFESKRRRYELTSLAGEVFPSGALRIELLVPSAGLHCAKLASQTRIDTLGRVGKRIYREELSSRYVLATVARIEADRSFQRAVAERRLAAIRAAIVSFFQAHIHVVRVRVYAVSPSGAERFLYDLGGPDVLAPVHGSVRSAGKLVGRFSMAIQDDAGYLKLAHLFTGAEVLMRRGTQQLIGTLDPGPAHVPDRGTLEYNGVRYDAYTFMAEAFPSGPLRISLLFAFRQIEG